MNKVEGKEPTDQLDAYFDLFRKIHGKGERMCPGGSFAAVFDAVSSPVQRRLHSFSQMHLQWLERVVREGVERGEFHIGDQRPRDVAMHVLAGVQGALLMGRLTQDPHVIDTVAVELRSYLSSTGA